MDKRLIITIPHYNNFDGLLKTIESISEQFEIDMIVGANAATATALEAIASEPEPASVDWKTGAIDIPVEIIPMDEDERDKKRGKKHK